MTDLVTYLRSKPLDLKLQAAADRLEELEKQWISELDELPTIGEPVIHATWSKVRELYTVNVKYLAVRHEGVFASPSRIRDETNLVDFYWQNLRGDGYVLCRGQSYWLPLSSLPNLPSPPTGEQET